MGQAHRPADAVLGKRTCTSFEVPRAAVRLTHCNRRSRQRGAFPRLQVVLPLLLSLIVAPAAARAQSVSLRINTSGGTHEIAAAPQSITGVAGGAFFPAAALERIGAVVDPTANGARAVLFGDTLVFTALSSFFRAGDETFHLPFPVDRADGVIQLPEQFFTEWLPRQYPDGVRFEAGALHITAAPAPAVARSTDRPTSASSAQRRGREAGEGMPAPSPDSLLPPPNSPLPTSRRGDGRREAGRRGNSTPVVVIDPGHGGRDPGRIGPTGLKEKDFTLALSDRLARLLSDRGYEVHLTRTGDTLIALDDRPRIANRLKGDRAGLFLSIHANAHSSARVRGFETFFLSDARTGDERRVAEMENAAIEFEDRSSDGDDAVGHILNDIRNDFYLRASNDLAGVVQTQLEGFHSGPDRGVKRAGFRVLVGALMPAVLVEVAFISNPSEARLLGTAAFQQKVAWALADAMDEFFAHNGGLWAGSR